MGVTFLLSDNGQVEFQTPFLFVEGPRTLPNITRGLVIERGLQTQGTEFRDVPPPTSSCPPVPSSRGKPTKSRDGETEESRPFRSGGRT